MHEPDWLHALFNEQGEWHLHSNTTVRIARKYFGTVAETFSRFFFEGLSQRDDEKKEASEFKLMWFSAACSRTA